MTTAAMSEDGVVVTVDYAESWLVRADEAEEAGDETQAKAAAGMAAALFSQLGRRWAGVRAGNSAEHYGRAAAAYRRAGRPGPAKRMAARADEMRLVQIHADLDREVWLASLEVAS